MLRPPAVTELMDEAVETVPPDESTFTVARKLDDPDVELVVVVEGSEAVGIADPIPETA